MKLKEEWHHRKKRTRVNRPVHPHSSSSPGAALGSVPTVALSSAQAHQVYHRTADCGRKQIDFCDGVDSPPRRLNPCGSTPARVSPWTWSHRPGVFPIMERRGARRTIERFHRCRADCARARTSLMVRGRPRRDGLRHGRKQKRTTEQTSQTKS